jgi:hypothetical protein
MTQEDRLNNYIEAVKLKLHAAILDAKAEAKANPGPFFHYKAKAAALTQFGIDAGLIDENDMLLQIGVEPKKEPAKS